MEILVPIVFFVCVAGVLVLRPISKNVGKLLEQLARSRSNPGLSDTDLASLRLTLEHIGKRMDLMEERLDFTERLLTTGTRSGGVREERARLHG